MIELRFNNNDPGKPQHWELFRENQTDVFKSNIEWTDAAEPAVWTTPWSPERPPSAFQVRWDGCTEPAWWPVNVESGEVLPLPEQLRDLPLDVLIQVLTSARPLHLHPALRNRLVKEVKGQPPADELDPHRKVDTSSFLLQRTRRVSAALTALRHRLERPIGSLNGLHWNLRGPVGALAVANAIRNETTGPGTDQIIERSFLIAELCLELHRAKQSKHPSGALDRAQFDAEVDRLIGELRRKITDDLAQLPAGADIDAAYSSVSQYVTTVFSAIGGKYGLL